MKRKRFSVEQIVPIVKQAEMGILLDPLLAKPLFQNLNLYLRVLELATLKGQLLLLPIDLLLECGDKGNNVRIQVGRNGLWRRTHNASLIAARTVDMCATSPVFMPSSGTLVIPRPSLAGTTCGAVSA